MLSGYQLTIQDCTLQTQEPSISIQLRALSVEQWPLDLYSVHLLCVLVSAHRGANVPRVYSWSGQIWNHCDIGFCSSGETFLPDFWVMVYGSRSRQIDSFPRGSKLTGHVTKLKQQPSRKRKDGTRGSVCRELSILVPPASSHWFIDSHKRKCVNGDIRGSINGQMKLA